MKIGRYLEYEKKIFKKSKKRSTISRRNLKLKVEESENQASIDF